MAISIIDFHAHVIPWESESQILARLQSDFPVGLQAYGGRVVAHDIVEFPMNEVFACACSPRGRLNPPKRVLIYVDK